MNNIKKKHILTDLSVEMCFLLFCVLWRDGRPVPYENLLLQAFRNSHSHGDGSTDHGVVAHA